MPQKIFQTFTWKVIKKVESWRRGLEGAAMALHLLISLPGRVIALGLFIYVLLYEHLLLKAVVIAYIVFCFIDRHTPHRGGRSMKININALETRENAIERITFMVDIRWNWLRGSNFCQYVASYFPLELKLPEHMPSGDNYLLVCYPHAVWFLGYTLAFGADVFNLQATKKLKTFMTTLNSNYWLPLAREYFLSLGLVTASEESLTEVLSEPEGGNLVCLLPGGSAEAAFSAPFTYRILLKNRKGFCRIALQTGASLVPTISFGEVDCFKLYMPPPDSWLAKCQLFVKNWTGVYPLVYKSPDSWFFMGLPKRVPITIVCGEPIKVQKKTSPSREEISELHSLYMERLQQLFETEKSKYLQNPEGVHLVIE